MEQLEKQKTTGPPPRMGINGHGSLARFTVGTDDESEASSGAGGAPYSRIEVPMGDDEMAEVVSDRAVPLAGKGELQNYKLVNCRKL